MLIAVRLIGLLIMALGIVVLVKPEQMRKLFVFFKQGKRIYAMGVLRIVLGIIFLLTATQCKMVGVITVLGILFLVAGILIFTLGKDKCIVFIEKVEGFSINVLRLLSLVAVGFGVLILIAA